MSRFCLDHNEDWLSWSEDIVVITNLRCLFMHACSFSHRCYLVSWFFFSKHKCSVATESWRPRYPVLEAQEAPGVSAAENPAPAFGPDRTAELRPSQFARIPLLRELRAQPEDPGGDPCERRGDLRHQNVRAGRFVRAADPSGH